ncbi:hypothetical protein V476_21785 [Pseudomonas syringae KCTC 12500]|uniref:hypothetical protein n=1 Tax=Pseudomonas syringae TaxID=317 RepID=UPI00046A6ADE|nr:hypothetical protein [Pseudomonas syringae]KMY03613.1 hypothetical protein V476_21785 [Pseudomonas syringae KCTC 12500]POR85134.1 hypothetical protein BKM21_14015 [Pseudomonas syringae pv. syringae]
MIPKKLPISRRDLQSKKISSSAKALRKLAPEVGTHVKALNIIAKILGYNDLYDFQNSALPAVETNHSQAEIDLYIAQRTFKISIFLNISNYTQCLQIARQLKLTLFESLRMPSTTGIIYSVDEDLKSAQVLNQGPTIPIIMKKRKRLLLPP